MLELLEQMLDFSYESRPTAGTCIGHKIFDSIRNEELEKPAPSQIILNDNFKSPQEAA